MTPWQVYWLARGHVGTHGTYGTHLANSHTLCESVNVTMKTSVNFYHMTTLRYLVIKEKLE